MLTVRILGFRALILAAVFLLVAACFGTVSDSRDLQHFANSTLPPEPLAPEQVTSGDRDDAEVSYRERP